MNFIRALLVLIGIMLPVSTFAQVVCGKLIDENNLKIICRYKLIN